MKQKTILSFLNLLTEIKESGKSIHAYCKEHDMNPTAVYDKANDISKLNPNNSFDIDLCDQVAELYGSIVSRDKTKKVVNKESVDTLNATEIDYERDEDNKIQMYSYKIYRKGKTPLVGKFTREEMNTVYRLYSYYGASLTQREVSRYFPELSLVDFKRILSAMNIYKASVPFAPHVIEETSMEDLRNMQLREKENDFLKKLEEDRIKNNERLLKKYAAENADLKKQLQDINGLSINIESHDVPHFKEKVISDKDLVLYLSDFHIGAKVLSTTLYSENIKFDLDEVYRRMEELFRSLLKFGKFNNIVICLMGDMIDCCGPTNKTSRLDHTLPENMDGFEQVNGYINVMSWFIDSLAESGICNHIKMYSVRCGNHTGVIEYVATKALFNMYKNSRNIECCLFDGFFGAFDFNNHTFVITHGKDEQFMKQALPLNLDDKNKVRIYEWLEDNNIHGKNIHIIKGDLHSSNYSSCMRFDYRNVLSLFGASDYSAYNYSRNSYGVSYDLMIGDNIVRGEFQNM